MGQRLVETLLSSFQNIIGKQYTLQMNFCFRVMI